MEAAAAKAEAAALPSPLYKPLHELTEDDIAQVTREDCRRFLKDKGMRRPSWNKSQAIQQVISLKALLEVKATDEEDGSDFTTPSPKRRAVASGSASSPVASVPPPPPPPGPSPPSPSLETLPGTGGVSSRLSSVPTSRGPPQMTIFYGGAVNVYDTMPLEKAVAILRVAASRDASSEFVVQMPVQVNRPIAPRPPLAPATTHLHPQPVHCSVGMLRYPYWQQREGVEDWKNSRDMDPEGPAGRRASLQRYLEKRKDRKNFKCKRGIDGLAPSDFELFLSQKVKPNPPFEQQYPHDTVSFAHSLHPSTPTRSYFPNTQGQTVNLSIDLNDDGNFYNNQQFFFPPVISG